MTAEGILGVLVASISFWSTACALNYANTLRLKRDMSRDYSLYLIDMLQGDAVKAISNRYREAHSMTDLDLVWDAIAGTPPELRDSVTALHKSLS